MSAIQLIEQAWLGAKMAPFEAWLLLRSLRTLPIRMQQHQENAMTIARFLEQQAGIKKVYYPGLSTFPGHDLATQQMLGFSGLMSFELATEDLNQIKAFVQKLRYFKLGVSWGGYESLIYAPVISYLKEQSSEQFKAMGIAPGLMRISIGLENKEDLMTDLLQGLSVL